MPPRRKRPPRAGALTELPPLKILRTILLLQTSYYAVALILLLFTVLVFGQKFSIGLVFDWNNIKRDSTLGWLIAIVWLLIAFFTYATPLKHQNAEANWCQGNTTAPASITIEARSRLCFDDTFLAFDHHFLVHESDTNELALVGTTDSELGLAGVFGCLGLQV